jgi:hypothetical protein
MEPPDAERDPSAQRQDAATPRPGAVRWLGRALPWHVGGFLGGNALLGVANALAGGRWWAFWPLLLTAGLLCVHYLLYKAGTVDERWVEERVEELNLKSYDRSHIEDLKERHGGSAAPGQSGQA